MSTIRFYVTHLLAALTTLSTSCSKVDFRGSTSSLKALDAVFEIGAQLKNTPSDPSFSESISVEVYGKAVSQYIFALVDGKASCAEATYSAPRPVSVKIEENVGDNGVKKLCVKGRSEVSEFQSKATEYSWTKESIGLQPFELHSPGSVISTSPKSISWSVSAGATIYKLSFASDEACANSLKEYSSEKQSVEIDLLKEGVYFICLEARDAAGNRAVAANTPIPHGNRKQKPKNPSWPFRCYSH